VRNFEYVTKREYSPVKKDLIKLIMLVKKEVSDYFDFNFSFIGSVKTNTITREINSNIGYDFDVNLRVNDEDVNFSAKEIKKILMNGFNKYNYLFAYDYCEDSKRVITIKVKDRNNSRILHSCDFAIVYDCSDGRQQYIKFNKNQNSYSWEYQQKGFYQLEERKELIKQAGLWQKVRNLYLYKKNNNVDTNKKSRSIFAETVNEIYNQNFEE
jgi:hypothetical protein